MKVRYEIWSIFVQVVVKSLLYSVESPETEVTFVRAVRLREQ